MRGSLVRWVCSAAWLPPKFYPLSWLIQNLIIAQFEYYRKLFSNLHNIRNTKYSALIGDGDPFKHQA